MSGSGNPRRFVLGLLAVFFVLLSAGTLQALASLTQQGAGSGFVVSSNGYILTNYHVVAGAGEIEVLTADGRSHTASLVDYSPEWAEGGADLALLKINADHLPFLPLGDSDDVIRYDDVIVLGYPLTFQLGVALTVTGGHISAFRQHNESLRLLQIDVPINPGNSGGPLLNLRGEVIGVVTASIKEAQAVNLAVPINEARTLFAEHGVPFESGGPYETITAQAVALGSEAAVV